MRVLDPKHPEALIYTKTDNGEMKLLGVMYVAPRGEGSTDGGELTRWHTHDALCMGYEDHDHLSQAPRLPGGSR